MVLVLVHTVTDSGKIPDIAWNLLCTVARWLSFSVVDEVSLRPSARFHFDGFGVEGVIIFVLDAEQYWFVHRTEVAFRLDS